MVQLHIISTCDLSLSSFSLIWPASMHFSLCSYKSRILYHWTDVLNHNWIWEFAEVFPIFIFIIFYQWTFWVYSQSTYSLSKGPVWPVIHYPYLLHTLWWKFPLHSHHGNSMWYLFDGKFLYDPTTPKVFVISLEDVIYFVLVTCWYDNHHEQNNLSKEKFIWTLFPHMPPVLPFGMGMWIMCHCMFTCCCWCCHRLLT